MTFLVEATKYPITTQVSQLSQKLKVDNNLFLGEFAKLIKIHFLGFAPTRYDLQMQS